MTGEPQPQQAQPIEQKPLSSPGGIENKPVIQPRAVELNPVIKPTPEEIRAHEIAMAQIDAAIAEVKQGTIPGLEGDDVLQKALSLCLHKSVGFTLINNRLGEIHEAEAAEKISYEDARKKEAYFKRMTLELQSQAARLDDEIHIIQKDTELPIERRAFAYDVEIHFVEKDKRNIDAQIAYQEKLKEKAKSASETVEIEAKINKLRDGLDSLAKKKEELIETRAQTIKDAHKENSRSPEQVDDQVVGMVGRFIAKLEGLRAGPGNEIVISEKTKEQIIDDPFGVIEDELIGAATSNNPDDRYNIGRALGIKENKQLEKLAKMLTLQNIERHLGIEDTKSLFKKGGLGGLLLLLMWLKLAMDKEKQGHGGGGGMMG